MALVQALGLVLILGKALNVKDMADIGSPGQIEQNILTLKVKEKKTKEEIREVLLVPPKKRELKVEEDDYDYCDEAEDDEVEDKHGDVEMTTREPHISVSEVVLRDSIGPAFAPARQSLAPYAEFGTALEKQPSVLARHSNFSAAHGRIRIHHSQAHIYGSMFTELILPVHVHEPSSLTHCALPVHSLCLSMLLGAEKRGSSYRAPFRIIETRLIRHDSEKRMLSDRLKRNRLFRN